MDDVDGDTSFSEFNIDNAPSYLFSVLSDILSINERVKIHILPWSPVNQSVTVECIVSFAYVILAWLDER